MREDADFDGYLHARWPSLVRTLVLLGCPEEIAPDVALDGVARCRADWSRARTSGDIEVTMHRSLLDAWDERRRTPWWRDLAAPDPSHGVVAPETVGDLDRLTPEARTLVVLERHGGLDRSQSTAATGRNPALQLPASPSAQELRDAVADVGVLAPPTSQAVGAKASEQRRRRLRQLARRAVVLAVPLVLLATSIGWWLSRDPPEEVLASVAVDRVENPAEVAWYADGRLHLEHVVLDVPALRQFEPVGGGAAYGDEQGRVVFVADDGSRTVLGHKEPSAPLAVSDRHGWVVWVEADVPRPRLVVHELASFGTFVARELVPYEDGHAARVIAVDGDIVFYEDGAGPQGWTLPNGVTLDAGAYRLLDASARVRVFQATPHTIRVGPPYASYGFTVPGTGGVVSEAGDLVLTRDTREVASFGPVLIYDTQSGADLSVGLSAQDVALAAQLGPDRTVTYIVARAEDRPENADFLRSSFSGQLELRTCEVDTGECEALERFPSTGSRPLLAY